MRLLRIVRVVGASMSPWAEDGDYVFAVPRGWWPDRVRNPGAVVLAHHARLGLLLKRVAEVNPDGCVRLAGDNPISFTTDALGSFAPEALAGIVIAVARRSPRRSA